jgi:SAM-dependent methyltransferase
MLAEARLLDPDYRLVRATAELPPFSPSSFDLVFCVHAFHHFPDKPHVVQSAYDVLKPGGAFAIVNFDPRECRWYIYDYFEGTYETDLRRFPALAEQEEMLRRAGFGDVSSPLVENIDSSLVGEAAFESYYLRKDACSQFILLSDEAYQAGINRMRAKIVEAKAKGESIIFRTQLKNRMCYGFKRA